MLILIPCLMSMRDYRKFIINFINFYKIIIYFFSIPETVPFRLTQNMVEAMGVLGTEGPFRKCCEVTLALLQNRKNVLMSYLRPFVFDPLIRNFSPTDNEPINAESMVAINMIRRKLNGYCRKYKTFLEIPLSTEGHVRVIIEEATSDANLAVMYFHWNPFV